MKLTLYRAADELRHLLDEVDPDTGELPEGLTAARELVATKAQAVAAYVLDTEARADLLEKAGKEMVERAKRAKKSTDWLRTYLRENMAASGITQITAEDGTFSAKLETGRDESVEIFDAAQLPDDYLREIPAKHEPDKALIKKAIKDGYEVPGARIVAKDRLTLK